MVTPRAPPLDPSKLIISIIFDSLWVCGAFGDMLTSIKSNYHFAKRPGARDMPMLGSHVGKCPSTRNTIEHYMTLYDAI